MTPPSEVLEKAWREELANDRAGPSSSDSVAWVLGELRSEYHQIRKAEVLMQRHRDKWMRSVEQWLDNQARVMKLPPDMQHQTSLAPRRNRRRKAGGNGQAVSALPSTATVMSSHPSTPVAVAPQIGVPSVSPPITVSATPGPQRPCPQPVPVEADELADSHSQEGADEHEVRGRRMSQVAVQVLTSPEVQDFHVGDMDARFVTSKKHEAILQASERGARGTHHKKKFRTNTTEVLEPWSVSWIVENEIFDAVCATMIFLNSVVIGVEVQRDAGREDEDFILKALGYICGVFFGVELIMRLWAAGAKEYFCTQNRQNRGWNIFDALLVVLSVVDFIMELVIGGDSKIVASTKTAKMLRIVRVFRVFRFFNQLSILALMIAESTANLLWAIILLLLIIYVFAILFTSEAATFINEHTNDAGAIRPGFESDVSSMRNYFGSISRTIYTLLQSMLGGVSWGVCTDALLNVGWAYCLLFIFYVAFTILAVMNVVTGVFVDNAVETARSQRDFAIQKEMDKKERYAFEMRQLFMEMDKDGSGTVGLEEINDYLEDPRVKAFFNTLGLDTNDTERLFKLIDDDGSGDVDVGEFLDGCLRLKGQARSLDVYAIMHDIKSLDMKVDDLMNTVCGGTAGALCSTAPTVAGPPAFSPTVSSRKGKSSDIGDSQALENGWFHATPSAVNPTVESPSNNERSGWAARQAAAPRVVTVTTTATATLA